MNFINQALKDLCDFRWQARQAFPSEPTIKVPLATLQARHCQVEDEWIELTQAFDSADMQKIAHELFDTWYVVLQWPLEFGLQNEDWSQCAPIASGIFVPYLLMKLHVQDFGKLLKSSLGNEDPLVGIRLRIGTMIQTLWWLTSSLRLDEALPELWQIGHTANMKKLEDGIRKDANGKILKPEGWEPPDFKPTLIKFGLI